MASKGQCRDIAKDRNPKQGMKPPHNELPDEIALRDEIFQLKRQIMLLKKANERNAIKVRKYEDEAKKKDRQIEQLMDPVRNGDVRKLLSTKGAALLLNLKEQNNALIQIILDKDVQIRKLLSEIKTSKLYANTRRAESYRNEIERLRNLLIKSQTVMKEAQEVPQRRSICVGGTPALEMTLSSDPSSPRDLEELQFTIQSLEMHMKYSNELLAKKNEHIIRLTDQLNSYQGSTCRKAIQTINVNDERDGSTLSGVDGNTYEIISPKSTALFDKNVTSQQKEPQDSKRLPNSAPAGPVRNVDDFADASRLETEDQSRQYYLGREDEEWTYGKIRFRLAEPTTKSDRFFIRESCGNNLANGRRNSKSSFSNTDDSDMETAEFELMEKKIENDQIEVESPVKLKPQIDGRSDSSGLGESPLDDDAGLLDRTEDALNNGENRESMTGSENDTVRTVFESENDSLRQKTFVVEETNDVCRPNFGGQSPLLSFDSESSTASMHEVEVEAEINHNAAVDDAIEDGVVKEEINEDDDDDDDDVVVC